jgi:hypothetical protein
LVLVLFGVSALQGCVTTGRVTIEKTTPKAPFVLRLKRFTPERLIFLSPTEASCPTKCSEAVVSPTKYAALVSEFEKALMERGYELVSGAIVSRVENKLAENETREQWDRTEKALLLGKDTGADSIFEVKAYFINRDERHFLKEKGEKDFVQATPSAVRRAIAEGHSKVPWFLWIPPAFPLGPPIYALLRPSPPSSFYLYFWEATVEARILDMDGTVLWSGTQSKGITDTLPEDWTAELKAVYGLNRAQIKKTASGRSENFDLNEYLAPETQTDTLLGMVRSLVATLPDRTAEGRY